MSLCKFLPFFIFLFMVMHEMIDMLMSMLYNSFTIYKCLKSGSMTAVLRKFPKLDNRSNSQLVPEKS